MKDEIEMTQSIENGYKSIQMIELSNPVTILHFAFSLLSNYSKIDSMLCEKIILEICLKAIYSFIFQKGRKLPSTKSVFFSSKPK